jgi:septum formation protein
MKIILGSQSARRGEILGYFAIPFLQVHSPFDEETVPFTGDPLQYVQCISEKKAESLVDKFPEEILLTADTSVYYQGCVYNKPKDYEEAFQVLSLLSGNAHQVFTGVTVRKGSRVESGVEETKIVFNCLSPQEIRAYLSSISYLDKAGGYAIQQAGSLIVKRIEGCYYNVMGLPMNTVRQLLANFGVNIWNFLKH